MLPLINSGGFFASTIPASTKPQFATGPQKCTVRGPVGESISALNLDPSVAALPAMGCDSSEEMKRYGRGDYNATDEETRSECVDESSHTIENDIASRIRKLVRKRAFR
jgi:hypothetical protein